MKKFATILAIAIAFIFSATSANAQSHLNWNDNKALNHRIHEVHVNDYLNKGDDEFRLGHYEAAMKAYKSAREHNNIDENIVPNRVIDQKMDRCADAMRRANSRDTWRDNSRDTWRNARPVSYNTSSNRGMNDLVEVRSNGMFYNTIAANRECRVLSVKNEFNCTVVEMEYINPSNVDNYISINSDTYLKDRNNGVKYSLRDADGIGTKSIKVYPGESHIFRLYFNRVSGSCRSVDIVEEGRSSWKFYNVPMRM